MSKLIKERIAALETMCYRCAAKNGYQAIVLKRGNKVYIDLSAGGGHLVQSIDIDFKSRNYMQEIEAAVAIIESFPNKQVSVKTRTEHFTILAALCEHYSAQYGYKYAISRNNKVSDIVRINLSHSKDFEHIMIDFNRDDCEAKIEYAISRIIQFPLPF